MNFSISCDQTCLRVSPFPPNLTGDLIFFFLKKGLRHFFSLEDVLRYFFSRRIAFEIFFLDFLHPPIINGRPLISKALRNYSLCQMKRTINPLFFCGSQDAMEPKIDLADHVGLWRNENGF